MTLKLNPNLRFLLSLGDTKMVAVQHKTGIQFYTNTPSTSKSRAGINVEHVAEAVIER